MMHRGSPLRRGVLATLACVTSVVACAAPSPAGAGTTRKLPSLRARCASTPSVPFQAIPFAERTARGAKLAVVGACIDGRGPYPFVVSTGVGTSVVAPALAHALGLASHTGAANGVRGVTCAATAPDARVTRWSIGGVRLEAQGLLVARVPADGLRVAPEGILGADVLSRFGAVRIDYRTKKLVIAQREGANPAGNVYLVGQPTVAPPVGLVPTAPSVSVALRVLESPAGTIALTPVGFGTTDEQFVVDSGSPGSSISPAAAAALRLASATKTAGLSGVDCKGAASRYESGQWSLGASALPPTSLVRQVIRGTANQGVAGVLGADVLSSAGAAVVDYEAAHLWLGPG